MNKPRGRRYQLNKQGAGAVRRGHPWVFRNQMSSAADVLRTGQWLELVGPSNEVLGYGLYESEGLIAIRVVKQGKGPPTVQWFEEKVRKALQKRAPLRNYTDAFRALHGENDGLPGVVIDVYGKTGVLQTYAPSVDPLGRYLARLVSRELGLESIVWKPPVKRKAGRADRVLLGRAPNEVGVREGKLGLTIPIGEGQKSGAFLDLRGLRKWVARQDLRGKRVLNLFSYTGTLGLAAEVAGAQQVWNVDVSPGALDVARRLHALQPAKHQWIAADIFEWLPALDPGEMFDLIIVDPPMMASRSEQVEGALRAYRKLYREALRHLKPRGTMVVACCTSRIRREVFEQTAAQVMGARLKRKASIAPEDDHPVGFPEGDYLKILVFA